MFPFLPILLLFAPIFATAENTASVAAAFKVAGIVPDVLPYFRPSALAEITFPYANGSSTTISTPGTRIGRNDSQTTPSLTLHGIRSPNHSQRYIAVIIDPDAPSRLTPTRRSIRHFLGVNLTLSATGSLENTTAADVVNAYRGPNPPAGSGPHRYVLFVYDQPEGFGIGSLNVSNIAGWNLTEWAGETGLRPPVAGGFFVAEVANATVV